MTRGTVLAHADQSPLISTSISLPSSLCYVTHSLVFRIVRCLLDFAAIAIAWQTTLYCRVALNPWMPDKLSMFEMQRVAPPLAPVLLLWAFSSIVVLGLYSDRGWSNHRGTMLSVLRSVGLLALQILAITAFSREFGIDRSRSFVPLFLLISFALLCASCYYALGFAWSFESRWPSVRGIAVIGRGGEADAVVRSVRNSKYGSLAFKGIILPDRTFFSSPVGYQRALGTTDNLPELINRERLSHIIVADHALTEKQFQSYCRTAREMGVSMSRPLPAEVGFRQVSHFGLDLMTAHPQRFERGEQIAKRAFDILVAFLALLLLSPVFLICMLAIKLTSKGPVFYRSVRVGRGGRYFTFWKFRSMWVNASRTNIETQNEKDGHIFKVKDDPRITPVGRIIRRFSLDEIPQLINVLLGDMSIVGPRPLPAEDMDPDGKSRNYRLWAEERAKVRPGITGLWQVSGRSELDFEQMVDLDVRYVQNWSLGMDLNLLAVTPFVVLFGRGAY